MDEAQAADVERGRKALELIAEMSPTVRRWLLDQLVTACAFDQNGVEWEIGSLSEDARRARGTMRPLSEVNHDADGT